MLVTVSTSRASVVGVTGDCTNSIEDVDEEPLLFPVVYFRLSSGSLVVWLGWVTVVSGTLVAEVLVSTWLVRDKSFPRTLKGDLTITCEKKSWKRRVTIQRKRRSQNLAVICLWIQGFFLSYFGTETSSFESNLRRLYRIESGVP